MDFDINGTVALITGGASGIGLSCARKLLKNGAKGITIADINEDLGNQVVCNLTNEFGKDSCVFVLTDVINSESFKHAFETTIKKFKAIDILMNSAGMCNDAIWEKEIALNLNGSINGVILGLEEYIPKYKTRAEGLIVNVSSIRSVYPSASQPIYAATKFAINGLTLAWGSEDHYTRTNVRVLAVCPGPTATPLTANLEGNNLGPAYANIRRKNAQKHKVFRQSVEECAELIIQVMKTGISGSIWIVEDGDKYQYVMPNRFAFKEQQKLH